MVRWEVRESCCTWIVAALHGLRSWLGHPWSGRCRWQWSRPASLFLGFLFLHRCRRNDWCLVMFCSVSGTDLVDQSTNRESNLFGWSIQWSGTVIYPTLVSVKLLYVAIVSSIFALFKLLSMNKRAEELYHDPRRAHHGRCGAPNPKEGIGRKKMGLTMWTPRHLQKKVQYTKPY
jgi:hypothetical protein